jgi:RHS repeat-associated protein
VTYTYDDAGRLTGITRGSNVFGFGYDTASRRTQLTQPNGVVTSYAYDVNSRLTSINALHGSTVITSSAYTHDNVGNRLTKATPDYAEGYSYDALYRLTQATRNSVVTEAHTYDAVGNRLSSLAHPTWTYDDRNELLSFNGTSFVYDLNGNTVEKADGTDTWTYEWDGENRLTRVLKNSVEVARFQYDPLGRRVEKVAGGVTRSYAYDGEDILRETAGSAAVKYVHGPGIDEPLASEDGGGVLSHVHADGLGSVVKVTSSTGTVTLTRQYDAWGNLQVGSGVSGYAFTGREWDSETGLYYYRARYYDAQVGRFNSEDPIGFHGGVNYYNYVGNGPVRFIDPLGLYSCTYYIREHYLECTPDNPENPFYDSPNWTSGNNVFPLIDYCNDCQDNPDRTDRNNQGPIRPGNYTINERPPRDPNRRYARRIDLNPDAGNNMQGQAGPRGGFQFHYCPNRVSCSLGCIANPNWNDWIDFNDTLALEQGNTLRVVPQVPVRP